LFENIYSTEYDDFNDGTFEAKSTKDDGGFEPKHPINYVDLTNNKVTEKINMKEINKLKINREINKFNTSIFQNIDILKFIQELIQDKNFTNEDEDSSNYWANKSNHTIVYQTVTRNGIIDLEKYRLNKKRIYNCHTLLKSIESPDLIKMLISNYL
jgi:hypothetical protein